jgi:hypothetical protein
MGMADSNETKTIDIRVLAKARPPSAAKQVHYREVTKSSGGGSRRRSTFIAVAAALIALAWWLS